MRTNPIQTHMKRMMRHDDSRRNGYVHDAFDEVFQT
jgi:hypothetical protein